MFECYFLNIIVNVNLKSEYYREYYPEILLQVSLKKETNIDGKGHKYFLKKLLGHEIFRSLVSWATNVFLKNL